MKVAVVGLGGIAELHARNLGALGEVELMRVASSDPARASAFAQRFAPAAMPSDYAEVFDDEDVEAVVLTARTTDHVTLGCAALRAGKHLFLEKPGATNLADHDRLRAEASAHPELVVQVAYNRRYDPDYLEAREALAAGAVGDPLVVLLTSRDPNLPDGEDPLDTGGFLLDVGAHDYDLACWFLGQEPVEAFAARQALVYPELYDKGDLDNALVIVRFDGGGLAHTHVSRTCPFGFDVRGEVLGTRGSLLVGNDASRSGVTVIGPDDRSQFPQDYADRFAHSFRAELEAFVRACRDDGPRGPTLDDDRRAIAVAVAARASAVEGRPVRVGADPPWPA